MTAVPRPSAPALLVSAAAFLAAAALVLTGPPAWAHADLVSSTPADGATLDQVPASIELVFSEEIDPQFVQIAVLASDQTPVQQGEAQVARERVSQPVTALANGDYTISYRVVSADGHPISGTVQFSVAGQPTPGPAAHASATPTSQPTSSDPVATATNLAAPTTTADSGSGSTPLLVGLALAAGAVALITILVIGRRPGSARAADD